ncbi:hypothetical protein BYT27DRAFT_7077625, partial [Phlegmacium glaucopus]
PLPASPPDRDLRQPRFSRGKVAYVIFGDQTTGIYYNWNSCEYKLNSYSHIGDWKPRYYGYATYDEATVAWAFYLETRIVPHSPSDGGVSTTPVPLAQPMTPQRSCHPFSYPSPSLRNLPTPAEHGSPSQASSVASSQARSRITSPPPPLYSQLAPLSQSYTLPIHQTAFFVVIVGYNPGVFASQ